MLGLALFAGYFRCIVQWLALKKWKNDDTKNPKGLHILVMYIESTVLMQGTYAWKNSFLNLILFIYVNQIFFKVKENQNKGNSD